MSGARTRMEAFAPLICAFRWHDWVPQAETTSKVCSRCGVRYHPPAVPSAPLEDE